MWAAISALSRLVSRVTLAFAALGVVAMTVIIGWQVASRYLLQTSLPWSEQAALVLMVWYVMLAAAVGVREQFHIRLSMAADALPGQLSGLARVASLLVVLAFGAAMGVWGAELVQRTWAHDIPTLGLPRGFAYLPLPIAGWLIVFFSLEHLAAEAQGRKVEPLWS